MEFFGQELLKLKTAKKVVKRKQQQLHGGKALP